MSDPKFVNSNTAVTDPNIQTIRATDGGTNDQKAVEVTGTSAGAVNTNLATLISGENQTANRLTVEDRLNWTNIHGAQSATTIAGAIYLHTIVVNTRTANGSVTAYDSTGNATTSPIASISWGASLLTDGPSTGDYDVLLTNGLTIATVGASTDVTITWRAAVGP